MSSYGVKPENIAVVAAGVAMSFPVNESPSSSPPSTSPAKLPRRLRHRLSKCRTTSTTTAEDIEAKLNGAHLRRQQFYESLSSKARPKQRCPPHSFDLGQRLEAKLNAAEQKRLSILTKAQKRLARLDKMRQTAKNELEIRDEKQRDELGMKVESRVKQAECNRMLILKSKQCSAARLVQVQIEANSDHAQQVMERLKKKDHIEDRIQKARRLRAEHLRQRKNASCSPFASAWIMNEQAEISATKIARSWRQFANTKGTTYSLTKAFEGLNITSKSVKSTPFEQLALLIASNPTLNTTKSFLNRLYIHLKVRKGKTNPPYIENIDHLLTRNFNFPNKTKGLKRTAPVYTVHHNSSRYPVRIALCAHMIVAHTRAVLSGCGAHETGLFEAAARFVHEFELLVRVILKGGGCLEDSGGSCVGFRSQLGVFDKAWCAYLYCFTVWKVKDVKSLEEDLVRVACRLELSMMRTFKVTSKGNGNDLARDMKVIRKQVFEDQILLKAKVKHLSGDSGIDRLESALSDVRTNFFTPKESSNPLASPISRISQSHSGSSSSVSLNTKRHISQCKTADVSERFSSIARSSSFKDDRATSSEVVSRSTPAEMTITVNEVLANEIIHENRRGFGDDVDISDEDNHEIKVCVF